MRRVRARLHGLSPRVRRDESRRAEKAASSSVGIARRGATPHAPPAVLWDMAVNGEEPVALDLESSQAKLQRARAELEEARAAAQKLEADNLTGKAQAKLREARAELEEARLAAKLEAITRAENMQLKLEEERRAQQRQDELEEARARLEQRVQAELEKARAARLEAKQKAEDRRAQRGARLAAHASREWTGVLEDVPECPPRNDGTGQLAVERRDTHAGRAFPEPPTHLPVPTPPAVVFKQSTSTFEKKVPSIPAHLAAEVQTTNLERRVENSPYSADAVFSEDSPHSITASFIHTDVTPARAPADEAKKEVVTANTVALIDGEQSMLERFESFLQRWERAEEVVVVGEEPTEEVVVVGQEVAAYESPKSGGCLTCRQEVDASTDEEQSMCELVESFLTALMEQSGIAGSSYSPYVEGAAIEKRTRCGCV